MHFNTERQQQEFAAALQQAIATEPHHEELIATRRSARHAKNVNYAEPAEDDEDSLFMPQDTPRKRRPSAISISRAQSISSTMSSIKSADFRMEIEGPPAERTRSKSITSELSDLGDMFDDAEGESPLEEDVASVTVGECVFVPGETRRREAERRRAGWSVFAAFVATVLVRPLKIDSSSCSSCFGSRGVKMSFTGRA